jgi:hypothetical protein
MTEVLLISDHAVNGTNRTAVENYLQQKFIVVPEPSCMALAALALVGLPCPRRRK